MEPHVVWINPVDAEAQGIRDGDEVYVFNDRGKLAIKAWVTRRIIPGVVAIHEGTWFEPDADGICRNGCVNVLTNDTYSPGGASALKSSLVRFPLRKGLDGMQKGFYFDQARCTGCFACSVACKDLHNTPAGPANWMQIKYREAGNFPKLFVSHQAVPCYHCANPVCSFVCPNDAITKREQDGVVVVDRDKCRGEKPCGIIDESRMAGIYLRGISPLPGGMSGHLYTPAYIALIAKGKNREALELIRRNMPLPSVCGRICLHPARRPAAEASSTSRSPSWR